MNYYGYPEQVEIDKLKAGLVWEIEGKQKFDDVADDGESNFIEIFYSGIQTFGLTDYKDHRKDSLAKLKKLIEPKINIDHQRLHFYNNDGSLVRKILVRGYLGGYSGHFVYEPDRIERSIKD